MFGFGKRDKDSHNLPGPKEIPDVLGRYLVVSEKKDPNRVWKLSGVTRHNADVKRSSVACSIGLKPRKQG